MSNEQDQKDKKPQRKPPGIRPIKNAKVALKPADQVVRRPAQEQN